MKRVLIINASSEAFDDDRRRFFEGHSVDELMWPMHLNFKFFGIKALPTFSSHDVMKAPKIKQDLFRFHEHLQENFTLQI